MYKIIILSALVAVASAAPRERRHAVVAAAPAVAAVPALAAVPTLTAVHSQRVIPQPPAVHTVARPTTVLQTVQTGNAVVGHQHVGDQVVGKTADVNGYAFKSEVRHDQPIAVAAPVAPVAVAAPAPVAVAAPAPVAVAAPAPVAVAAPAPVPVAAPALPILSAVPPPAPVQTVHPAPPAQVKSYSVETGHQLAHDHVVTSPVIKQTVHSPVIGSQPIIGQVPVAAPAPILAAPAPVALPAPAPVPAY